VRLDESDADAGRDPAGEAGAGLAAQRCQQCFGHPPRIGRRGLGEQHGELVAAQTGHHVAVAQAATQQVGHAHDELIARGVTQRVVDELEVVEIQGQESGRRAVAPRAGDLGFELLLEAPAVEQAGQRLAVDQALELGVVTLALGDVGQHRHPEHPVLGMLEGRHVGPAPHGRAGAGHTGHLAAPVPAGRQTAQEAGAAPFQLARVVAQDAFERRVGVQDRARAWVEQADALGHGVGDQPHERQALLGRVAIVAQPGAAQRVAGAGGHSLHEGQLRLVVGRAAQTPDGQQRTALLRREGRHCEHAQAQLGQLGRHFGGGPLPRLDARGVAIQRPRTRPLADQGGALGGVEAHGPGHARLAAGTHHQHAGHLGLQRLADLAADDLAQLLLTGGLVDQRDDLGAAGGLDEATVQEVRAGTRVLLRRGLRPRRHGCDPPSPRARGRSPRACRGPPAAGAGVRRRR
jgi:hypothetical protein